MRAAIWPAIFLAAIAGFVDALGYLELAHVFTAHMSGNAAATGALLGAGDWNGAWLHGVAIPGFLVGVVLGVLAEDIAVRRHWPMRLAPAFALELGCLAFFAWLSTSPVEASSPGFLRRVTLLAAAMGLQSATLRRAGGRRIQTTFVTGMLVDTTEEFMAWLLRRPRGPNRFGLSHARSCLMLGSIFLSFVAGTIAGSLGHRLFGPSAMLAPAVALIVVIVDDVVHAGRPTEGQPG